MLSGNTPIELHTENLPPTKSQKTENIVAINSELFCLFKVSRASTEMSLYN